MTSSSAPPAPASEPFRFTDAARLHARRFNKHPVASALRLLSADQRITHPDGGIALLTEVGHVARATALFAATYVPAFLGMVYGFAIGSVPLIAVTLPAVIVSALALGSRCERQIRARRTFDTAGHPWVLSDVATEPHLGIGYRLLAEVVRRAEEANTDIVLTVGEDNEIARALYARHHFRVIDGRGRTIAMRRRARADRSQSHPPQAGDGR
ncbi:MAG: GNAT family N-acetyltransferase [Actinomycetota bacterium]